MLAEAEQTGTEHPSVPAASALMPMVPLLGVLG
jgi:hypothetical protein